MGAIRMTTIGTSRHTARHTVRSPRIGGRVTPASDSPRLTLAPWAQRVGSPTAESAASRRTAHIGGLAAIGALLAYLSWRIAYTLPVGGWNLSVAWTIVAFESLPMIGLVVK